MEYFAWDSRFFASYTGAASPPPMPGGTLDPPLQTDIAQTDHEGDDPRSRNDTGKVGGKDMGHDIRTEFKTREKQPPSVVLGAVIYPCIQELGLITSNTEHLHALRWHAPKSCFGFQLIQHARLGNSFFKAYCDVLRVSYFSCNIRQRGEPELCQRFLPRTCMYLAQVIACSRLRSISISRPSRPCTCQLLIMFPPLPACTGTPDNRSMLMWRLFTVRGT